MLKRYTQKLHKDLPPTQLQGYIQVNKGTDGNGKNTIAPPGKPYYLGPMIIAQRDRPVRVKFTNQLPAGSGGDLFLPLDTTIDGAGPGPKGGTEMYTQNRATMHLHGGRHPVDQRRHAVPVDHAGGDEDLLPQGCQCPERARHARSGLRAR